MYSLISIEVGDKMDTDTLGAAILGIFITGMIYLIGGIDELMTSLIIIMIIDFILGIMAAYSTQSLNSYKIFKVLLKKIAMILMIILAVQLDLVTDSRHFLRNMMILFLIGVEGVSIVGYLKNIGIAVPQFLINIFSKLRDMDDKKRKK